MKESRTIAQKRKLVNQYNSVNPFHCLLGVFAIVIISSQFIKFYGASAVYILLALAVPMLYYGFFLKGRNFKKQLDNLFHSSNQNQS